MGLAVGAVVGLTVAAAVTVVSGVEGLTHGALVVGLVLGGVVGLAITAVVLLVALAAGRQAQRGSGWVEAVHLVAALVLAEVALVISSCASSLPPGAAVVTAVLGGAEVFGALLLTRAWRTTALRARRSARSGPPGPR